MRNYVKFIYFISLHIIINSITYTEITNSNFANSEMINNEIVIVFNGGFKKYSYDLTLINDISLDELELNSNSKIYILSIDTFIICDKNHIYIIQNNSILKSYTVNSYYNNYLAIAVISETSFIIAQSELSTYKISCYLYSINENIYSSSYSSSYQGFNIECNIITISSSKYAICFFINLNDFNVYSIILNSSLSVSNSETKITFSDSSSIYYISSIQFSDNQIILAFLNENNILYIAIYEINNSFSLNLITSTIVTSECYNGGQYFYLGKLNDNDIIIIYPSIQSTSLLKNTFYVSIYTYSNREFILNSKNKNIEISFTENINRFFKIMEIDSEYAINFYYYDSETLKNPIIYFGYLTLPKCIDFTIESLETNIIRNLNIKDYISLDGGLLIHPNGNIDNILLKVDTADAPSITLLYDNSEYNTNTFYNNLDKWTIKTGNNNGSNYIDYTVYNSLNYKSQSCEIVLVIGENTNDINQIVRVINQLKKNFIENAINSTYVIKSYFIVQVYNTSNASLEIVAKNSNLSEIYLNNCENILRKIYNIPENEVLLIIRIDVQREDTTSYQVEYEIYSENLTELNLSYCKNENIIVKLPHFINENLLNKCNKLNNFGYDFFNSNNSFYNNICTRYTSEYNTDMTINDRRKYYYTKELLCEENCNYVSYNCSNMKVTCDCPVKTQISSYLNYTYNYIKKSFNKSQKYTNIKVFKCFKVGFENFNKNAGGYILLIIILGYFTCIFFVFFKGFSSINIYLNKSIFNDKKNFYIANPPKKSNIENNKKEEKNINQNPLSLIDDNPISLKQGNEDNKKVITLPTGIKKVYNIDHFKENKTYENIHSFDIIENYDKENEFEKQKEIEFSHDELCEMSIEIAFVYDKRKFFEYYIPQIKFSQMIYFIFFYNKGYYIFFIKLLYGLLSISFLFLINTFLYTDKNISHYYKNKGKYDFKCEFLKIFISSIICYFINMGIKYLILRRKEIQNLNELKYRGHNSNDIKEKCNDYIRNYKKLIFFYSIISTIIIIIIWFYLINFCSVFFHSQKNLMIRIAISFILIMIYPFIFIFIPYLLRYLSLKKSYKLLYIISQILQYL